jgi:DNA-binding GntR family transcriptional regulator
VKEHEEILAARERRDGRALVRIPNHHLVNGRDVIRRRPELGRS